LTLICVVFCFPNVPTKGESPTNTPTIANQWSGFQNQGHPNVEAGVLPTEWSPTSGIVWQSSIDGYGQSTPICGHKQIVVTSTSGPTKEHYHIASYRIDTGVKQWQLDLANPSPVENTSMVSRAAPTSVVTSDGFISLFEGGLVVATSVDGKVRWQLNLVDKFGKIEARHGLAGSLEQNEANVFVWIERTEDPYLLAIDKHTGEIDWNVAGIGATSWASPRLIRVDDGQHLVCSGSGKIVGYNPKTGDRFWEFDGIENNSSCTPMPVGNGTFLIGASDGRGESNSGESAQSNGLMKIHRSNDGTFSLNYVWQSEHASCSFGSPVVARDRALFVNRAGILYQLDLKSGQELSATRTSAGGIWATPIVVGESVYLFGYKGETSVVSLRSGKEIAVNRTWNTAKRGESQPSNENSGGTLYAASVIEGDLAIRSGNQLYLIATPRKDTQ
jgi:outer membrane protein assembly factor BamB